jgi:phosphoheptose isomerase
MSAARLDELAAHVTALRQQLPRIDRWGGGLAERLGTGGRLLAVGNGGSAAEAQHLTSELVGRFRDERRPLSALCLSCDSSSLTAIGNDYGYAETFARQVRAHGRWRDVLVAFSTSGRSENVVAAVGAAAAAGLWILALTGPAPNPVEQLSDEALCFEAADCATVQELHLVAIHLLCEAIDRHLAPVGERRRALAASP